MDKKNAATPDQQNLFPYPAEPIQKGPPKVWDHWRDYTALEYLATGRYRTPDARRLLEAYCGAGFGLWHLAAQNPGAEISGFEPNPKAAAVARERLKQGDAENVQVAGLNVMDLSGLEGAFDLIVATSVVHHLADPDAGLRNLTAKLREDGLMVLYLYSSRGRWQIALMQRAIKLLQEDPGNLVEGLRIGRTIFDSLPNDNALAQFGRKNERAYLRDEAFVDTFVAPCIQQFTAAEVFALLDREGLEFVRFSDEASWQLDKLLRDSPPLLKKAARLLPAQRYELADVLNPARNGYHLLARKKGSALPAADRSDEALLRSIAHRRRGVTFDTHDGRRCVSFLHQPKIIRTFIDGIVEDILQRCDDKKTMREIIEESRVLPRLLPTERVRRLQAAFRQLESYGYVLFELPQ